MTKVIQRTKARFLSEMGQAIRYEEMPGDVVDRVKYLALDYVGLAARGSRFVSTSPVHQFLEVNGGSGAGTVIGKPMLRILPQYAALANGVAAHSLELDDVHNESSLHPAVAVFPAAFATGETRKVSGKTWVESVVFGYEVMARIGKALHPTHHYRQGFHPTGTCGVFGGVAAASKTLGLSAEQTTNAFGIAGSQAAGSMEFLENGSWTKRLHPGWAAQSGIIAAEIAEYGFTGPASILEGDKGFARAYSTDFNLASIEDEFLYNTSAVMRTSIKAHACCRYKQGPLDLLLYLVNTHDIQPEEVQKVHIYLVGTALPIISLPEETKQNPQSSVDAQFSMPFGAAMAILKRRTLLEEYEDEWVRHPDVRTLMSKVASHHDPELDKEFPQKWPARVVIETTKGTFSGEIEYPKGEPENPLSWDEMISKFMYVSGSVYSQEQQERIIEAIRRLEAYSDISEVTALL